MILPPKKWSNAFSVSNHVLRRRTRLGVHEHLVRQDALGLVLRQIGSRPGKSAGLFNTFVEPFERAGKIRQLDLAPVGQRPFEGTNEVAALGPVR